MVEAHVLLGSGKRTRYTFAILAWSVSRVCDKNIASELRHASGKTVTVCTGTVVVLLAAHVCQCRHHQLVLPVVQSSQLSSTAQLFLRDYTG